MQVDKKLWKGIGWGLFFSLIIWGLIFIGISHATSYYVNSASDGGDGTTTATTGAQAAFKTIAAAQAAVTGDQHGNSLLFNKGNTWREQFTVGANGTVAGQFTIGSYGSGDKPKIYGSTQISTWTQDSIAADTWADAFTGGTNHIEDRAGWSAVTRAMDSGADKSGYWVCANNRVENGDAGVGGIGIYNLATDTPPSTDYYVQADVWLSTDSGHPYGPIIRGAAGTGNTLTGYTIYIRPDDDKIYLVRYNNGAATALANAASGWTSTSPNTIRLDVSGTGATVTVVVSVGGAVKITYNDTAAGRITTTGLGGLASWHGADTEYEDNFIVGMDAVSLPAGTWRASSGSTDSVWFIAPSTGTITWGKEETVLANVNAEYDWYYDSLHGLLIVYAATTPDTRYASVEASARNYCIVGSEKNYITISGIECAYAISGIGTSPASNIQGTNWVISNNTIHHIGEKNSSSADGIKIYGSNCSVLNNTIHNIGTHGVYVLTNDDTVTVDGTLIEGNEIYDCYHTGIDVMNIHGTLTNTIIRKNKLYYTTDYNVSTTSNAIYVSGDTAGHVVDTVNISYNEISNIRSAGIQVGDAAGTEKNINIYNNTIYERLSTVTGVTGGIVVSTTLDAAGANNIRNNIVSMTLNTADSYLLQINASGDLTSFSNNILYRIGGTGTVYAYVDAADYHSNDQATYITVMGGKGDGTLFVDPLFQSATDLRLKPTSPAINAGVDVSLTSDYRGRKVPVGTPDMGAYELSRSVSKIFGM